MSVVCECVVCVCSVSVSEIKDFSDAHVGCIIPQNHAPGQICVHPSQYDIFNVQKRQAACIFGCMGLKVHAPDSKIMHARCRVHL